MTKRQTTRHALYSELKELLARFGTEDASGNEDYYLIDDDYRARIQKVTVARISFITRECVAAVQGLLARRYPDRSVTFALDLRRKSTPGHENGVIAFADHVEVHWDQELLARMYGDQFKRRP